MIQKSRFVIAVPNLERSAAYYREVLGFEIQSIGDPGWRFYVKDDCCIMAGECPDAIPPQDLGDHSYFAYLVVADVDTYFQQVNQASGGKLTPPQDKPWGLREFGVRTVDGHRINIGMPIENSKT